MRNSKTKKKKTKTQEIFPKYKPNDVAEYYGFPSDSHGNGQKIGIISLGGKMDMTELAEDFKKLGFEKMPKISSVDVKKIDKDQRDEDITETHLDVEIIGSICSEATIVVYRGWNGHHGLADAVEKAVEDKCTVISISWGGPEEEDSKDSQLEKALIKARKAGVSVCAATGDNGSSDLSDESIDIEKGFIDGYNDAVNNRPKDIDSINEGDAYGDAYSDGYSEGREDLAKKEVDKDVDDGYKDAVHVDYPASSEHVLACGGTELDIVDGKRKEFVWNDTLGATGGGVSEYINLPIWQFDHGISINSLNVEDGERVRVGRVVPDVAGLASGVWKIFETEEPDEDIAAGTSAVAPLWAALIAIANEKRAKLKPPKGPLGFLNEALYKLAKKNGNLFTDVTEGNNTYTVETGYNAKVGYDACTGLGTPKANKLIPALVKLPEQDHEYWIGLHPDLGGYLLEISEDGKSGLVVETQDQGIANFDDAKALISDPSKHSKNGKKFHDWRLPTATELAKMQKLRKSIGDFKDQYYLSESETGIGVWGIDFKNGKEGDNGDKADNCVRSVRDVKLEIPAAPEPGSGDKHYTIGLHQELGGYVVRVAADGKSGLVVSEKDLASHQNWNSAMATCESSKESGFSDWRLPNTDEWDAIYANLVVAGHGNFNVSNYYWTASPAYGPGFKRAMSLSRRKRRRFRHPILSEERNFSVRAVRSF